MPRLLGPLPLLLFPSPLCVRAFKKLQEEMPSAAKWKKIVVGQETLAELEEVWGWDP